MEELIDREEDEKIKYMLKVYKLGCHRLKTGRSNLSEYLLACLDSPDFDREEFDNNAMHKFKFLLYEECKLHQLKKILYYNYSDKDNYTDANIILDSYWF